MLATPWKVLREAQPGREYLVLLSFLPLRRFRDFPAFARHDIRITRQLRTAPGLVGYSKLGRPWVKRFWTLSAWEDEAALAGFVHAGSHVRAMAELPRAWVRPASCGGRSRGRRFPRRGTTPSAAGRPPSRITAHSVIADHIVVRQHPRAANGRHRDRRDAPRSASARRAQASSISRGA